MLYPLSRLRERARERALLADTAYGNQKAIVMRYAVVIELAGNNYSAYVPDLPGCVATGASKAVVESLMRDAIELHLAGMREDGDAIPLPSSQVEYIDVTA